MKAGSSIILALAAALCSSTSGFAEDKRISPIRKAAIERMQQKLGTLRGSIAPQDTIIMLTNRLLDMQKPVRQSSNRIRGSRGFDTLTTAGTKLPIDARGALYSPQRKSLHSGFTLAAGEEPARQIDESDPEMMESVADTIIDEHGL